MLQQWATWSNGYTGDVYWTGDGVNSVSISLPSGTSAFYFYAQPQNAGVHTITAVAFDGISEIETISQDVEGDSGASYYGFYGTEGTLITEITVYGGTIDFAIGEFGISIIPAPEAFLLCNVGLSFVFGLKRLHKL